MSKQSEFQRAFPGSLTISCEYSSYDEAHVVVRHATEYATPGVLLHLTNLLEQHVRPGCDMWVVVSQAVRLIEPGRYIGLALEPMPGGRLMKLCYRRDVSVTGEQSWSDVSFRNRLFSGDGETIYGGVDIETVGKLVLERGDARLILPSMPMRILPAP